MTLLARAGLGNVGPGWFLRTSLGALGPFCHDLRLNILWNGCCSLLVRV